MGIDYKNNWHRDCSDQHRRILESYVAELAHAMDKFHLKLVETGMDPAESVLRLDGVNRSDP